MGGGGHAGDEATTRGFGQSVEEETAGSFNMADVVNASSYGHFGFAELQRDGWEGGCSAGWQGAAASMPRGASMLHKEEVGGGKGKQMLTISSFFSPRRARGRKRRKLTSEELIGETCRSAHGCFYRLLVVKYSFSSLFNADRDRTDGRALSWSSVISFNQSIDQL